MMREIWKSIAQTSAARGYSLIISAAMIMIVARWLGPAGQGTIAAAIGWATLFATLGSLSLGQVALHRATIRRGQQWLRDTLGTLIVLALLLSAGCWAVAFALYLPTYGRTFGHVSGSAILVAFLIVPFTIWEFYGGNLLTAIGHINIYNRAQLVGRTAGLALMLICWALHLSVLAAISITVVSQAVVSITGFRDLWRAAGGAPRVTAGEARALVGGALQLHINAISAYIYMSVGVLIVNHYCSTTQTGWYQFAASLVNVMLVIPLSASLVLSAEVAQRGPDEAWSTQRRVLLYLPLVMIVAAVAAAFSAPVMIPLVVGAKYIPSVVLFQWSLLAIVGLTFASLMSSQWIGRGYFWQMSVTSVVIAIAHLAVTLLLVRRHGMFGAVYANIATSTVALVGNGIFAIFCELRFRRYRLALAMAPFDRRPAPEPAHS